MIFRRCASLSAFAEGASPLLNAADPLAHSLLRRLESGLARGKRENWAGFLGEREEGRVLCALVAPPHPVYLLASGPVSPDELLPLTGELPAIRAVRGEKALAAAFAAASGRTIDRQFDAHLLRLDSLTLPPTPQGIFRRAMARDQRFFPRWMNPGDWNEAVWVWENEDIPVSMAHCADDSSPLGWISSVFTPPEYRRQGYATALVGTLTRTMAEKGKRCCLAVDIRNEKALQIYRRLGYRPAAMTTTITLH